MNYFSAIPEGQAIVHSRGVYRQVAIYERAGRVYARYGAGYVKLSQGGSTSHPNVRWAEIDPGDGTYSEAKGAVSYHAVATE
ncbi:MAG: hypothetical protein ACPG4X_22500 [Pikeienuella sp.]